MDAHPTPPPLSPAPASAPKKSLGARLSAIVLRAAVGFGVLLVIGYCASDRKDYPGKAEFEVADQLIANKSTGTTHGNTPEAKAVAMRFSAQIKPLQAALFTGGSGNSLASGGEFLTYCRHNPDSVVFMVHVPELRNYKVAKTRESLGQLAWVVANASAKELKFADPTPTIIVGLRGFASYGPIWSGKLGGEPELKTDDLDEKRRLYPHFVAAGAR